MKQTLKQQLEAAQRSIQYWTEREAQQRAEKDAALKKLEHLEVECRMTLTAKYQDEHDKNAMLFEIIRWNINPSTAQDPFNHIAHQRKNLPNY